MRNLLIYGYVDTIARLGSIRKAAPVLALTPSALNRRILSLEAELGVQIFERLGRGVRLSAAGEQFVHLFRRHLAEVERTKSQVADMSGLRSGHVAIACSQAVLPFFLPEQIHEHQQKYPGVTFKVLVRDGDAAERALLDYSADIAVVFEPLRLAVFQTLASVRQPVHAVLSRQHPLARKTKIRLTDCLDYPLALPSAPYAVRTLLQEAFDRAGAQVQPAAEAESYVFLRSFAALGDAIAFEIQIGVPSDLLDPSLVSIPLDLGGRTEGLLHVAQLRGRTPSVAAARFSHQIITTLTGGER